LTLQWVVLAVLVVLGGLQRAVQQALAMSVVKPATAVVVAATQDQ
jgi:hypothetical protein